MLIRNRYTRWKRGLIASAGSIFNIVFAFLILSIAIMPGKHLPLFDAMMVSLKTIGVVCAGTINLLLGLFSGSAPMDSLSGPIGIAIMAGKAADAGFISFLSRPR